MEFVGCEWRRNRNTRNWKRKIETTLIIETKNLATAIVTVIIGIVVKRSWK